jgi:hypothetical protein
LVFDFFLSWLVVVLSVVDKTIDTKKEETNTIYYGVNICWRHGIVYKVCFVSHRQSLLVFLKIVGSLKEGVWFGWQM